MPKSLIEPNLTIQQISDCVDQLITPERADAEAKCLINILRAVTDGETSDDCHDLAMVASHRAYQKTIAYDNDFKRFAGIVEFELPACGTEENEKPAEKLDLIG